MDAHAPIPDELLHRAPRPLRTLRTVVLVVVLVGSLAAVLRFAFEPPPPMFRNFGLLNTRVGAAVVACGGEITESCGDATALVFESCDTVHDYFPNANDPPSTTDTAVRRLLGKRPPAGSRWAVSCGHDGLQRDHRADLESI